MKHLAILSALLLTGCGAGQMMGELLFGTPQTPTEKAVETVIESSETLTVLSAIGGLCVIAGMALLVISRGTMGWRPIIGGILLVLLNYVIARYADWIFIPVIIATGCISAAWGWNTILEIFKEKKHEHE
tara:strand:- start:7231 stop:7620 length:390 start_codon:yes stop_codon:yes gene_type:complete